ncbi:MAG: propionate CoA-transferase [Methylobacteriaceae bacterium]|nr:propionate CoA-transferase [Methylobacteriaceae bacterium]
MSKRITAPQAARLVHSGDTVASVGVIGWITPDSLLKALADRFREEQQPRDISFYFPCGTGDGVEIRGMDHVAIEGLMKRIVSGSYVNPLHPQKRTRPELMRLIRENRVEAYSWPIGASMHWLREVARKSPGYMTRIGLGTYADPRQQGGKFTARATEDLVELIEFRGEQYLFYPTFPLNVGFIRASSADEFGNLSYEDEALMSSNTALALAVKACGGTVIAQVRREVPRYSRPAHHCRVPGVLVDHYVVEPDQMAGTGNRLDPIYLGGRRAEAADLPRLPLGPDKVIARRAAAEVVPGRTSIFGFGASSDAPLVMAESGAFDNNRIDEYQFTTEHGPFGGVVMSGWQFSANMGPEALLDGLQQFDFIDGGNCSFAALAFAQFDATGNVNVSRFGASNPGAGGFIDIAQNAKDLVFTGTFTTAGFSASIGNGGLRVETEGSVRKFVQNVDQITYPVRVGVTELGQSALVVTERAVFRVEADGLAIVEIAEGIDLRRDVLDQMEFQPTRIAEPLPKMDAALFAP